MFRTSPFGNRFDSMFRELEDEMRDMERRMNRMLEQARESNGQGEGPLVYGWTMNVGPEGTPQIRRFGNVEESGEDEWRKPHVTSVFDDDKNVIRVTAELPGVEKDNIDVETYENGLRLEAVGEDRKYRTKLPTDAELDPETAEARFNNGILEITVGLAEATETEGHEVTVR